MYCTSYAINALPIYIMYLSYLFLFPYNPTINPFSLAFFKAFQSDEYLSSRIIPNYEDNDYNLRNFDYSKEICTADFQHPWNTNRDLILTGGCYDFEYISKIKPFLLESIVRSAAINRASAPNCKIVFVFFHSKHIDIFAQKVAHLNITIYIANSTERNTPYAFGALNRYHYMGKYLADHRTEFDRVFFCDCRDVVMFTDAFGTFDNETVHFIGECYSNLTGVCSTFGTNRALRRWIKFLGSRISNTFITANWTAINCGVFYGGTDAVLQVFMIVESTLKKWNLQKWGYDTAVFNYCYYMGLFDGIKNVVHHCSNLVCFLPSDIHYYPEKKSLYQYVNGKLQCAPIILHGTKYLKRDFRVLEKRLP